MELSYPTHFAALPLVEFSLPLAMLMFCLHCLVGFIAARVAYRKGANLRPWLIWGMIGGTLALITACQDPPRLPMRQHNNSSE
ncbi:MAG: hypothetical protein AAGE59_20275 [Cyanobacteria bacterium P01_F01_bin.86]